MCCWYKTRLVTCCCCISIDTGVIIAGISELIYLISCIIFIVGATSRSHNYLVLIGTIPTLIFVRTPRSGLFLYLLFNKKSLTAKELLYKTWLITFLIGTAFSLSTLIIFCVKLDLFIPALKYYKAVPIVFGVITFICLWFYDFYLICIFRQYKDNGSRT
jgi:hypothetical protein